MATTYDRPFIRADGTDVWVEIEVDSWGSDAQVCGPPESCHDGDPMEVHVTKAWRDLDDGDVPASVAIELTDAERERAETDFMGDPPEFDSYDDWD